jgi:hypothetical protein
MNSPDVAILVTPSGEFITDPEHVRHHLKLREDAVKRLATDPAGPQADTLRAFLADNKLALLEVKSVQVQKAGIVRMSKAAVSRKRAWERRYAAKFSTVIADQRRGKKYSGHLLYYVPDVHTVKLADAEPVAGPDEILERVLGG